MFSHSPNQSPSVAPLIATFRSAATLYLQDPGSAFTKEAVHKAHQALPRLCNLVFGQGDEPGLLHASVHNGDAHHLLRDLAPAGPVLSVALAFSTDRSEYVFNMNSAFSPLSALFRIRINHGPSQPSFLNMLEFYLLHFAYAGGRRGAPPFTAPGIENPISPLKRHVSSLMNSAQSLLGRSSDPSNVHSHQPSTIIIYHMLLQRYLHFFVPLSCDHYSLFCPHLRSPAADQSSFSPRVNYSADYASFHPIVTVGVPCRSANVRLTCSQFFVACIVECWLGQDLYDSSAGNDKMRFRPMIRAILEGLIMLVEHISCTRLLHVLTSNPCSNSALSPRLSSYVHEEQDTEYMTGIALRYAFDYLTAAYYRFIHVALLSLPLIVPKEGQLSLHNIVPMWIRWLTPLCTTSSFTENGEDLVLIKIDQYLIRTLPFYTTLVHKYIDRVLRELDPSQVMPRLDGVYSDSGYSAEFSKLCYLLQVFATCPQKTGPGRPSVYLTRVARMEAILLGHVRPQLSKFSPSSVVGHRSFRIDTNLTDQSLLRATLDSQMMKLEAAVVAPAETSVADLASGSVPSVGRGKWRMIATSTEEGTYLLHKLAHAAILGFNTRLVIIQPYEMPIPGAPQHELNTPTRTKKMTRRMLKMAPLRTFSATHVLMPAGMATQAVSNELGPIESMARLASGAARISDAEWTSMMQDANEQVHALTMHLAGSAPPRVLTSQVPAAVEPESRSLSSAWPGWAWRFARSRTQATSLWFFKILHRFVPEPWRVESSSMHNLYVTKFEKDGVKLLDTGREQVIAGSHLCPYLAPVPTSAFPRDVYLPREVPMLVDLTYIVQDFVCGALEVAHGAGHRRRALDAYRKSKEHASVTDLGISEILNFASEVATCVHPHVSFRWAAERVTVAWTLLFRLVYVVWSLHWFPSILLYLGTIAVVVMYPFSRKPTPGNQLPVMCAALVLYALGTLCVDHQCVERTGLVAWLLVGAPMSVKLW